MIRFEDFLLDKKVSLFLKEAEGVAIQEPDTSAADAAAYKRMRIIITLILTRHRFFSHLITHLPLVKNNSIPTMATDGRKIYYNVDFTNKLTEEEDLFVVCHEIMHCILGHFDRTRPDKTLWNIATDLALNPLIKNIGKMPENILYEEEFFNMAAERIYDILSPEVAKSRVNIGGSGQGKGQQGQSGQQGQGQGPEEEKDKSGGAGKGGKKQEKGGGMKGAIDRMVNVYNSDPRTWNFGDVGKPGEIPGGEASGDAVKTGSIPEDLAKVWKERAKDSARKIGKGSIKGPLGDFIDELVSPQVNWRSELKNFINTISNKIKYAIPYKRFAYSGTYLPGPVKENAIINPVIAVDTSGSISGEDMAAFSSEVKSLAKAYNMQDIHVIYADADVQSVKTFKDGSQLGIQMSPGGGTSFKPTFDWVENNLVKKGKKPAFFIYLTDGHGDMPTTSTFKDRTLWIIVNDKAGAIKVPFGKKIDIISQPVK
jgi:predicted metal-dependent peptidase